MLNYSPSTGRLYAPGIMPSDAVPVAVSDAQASLCLSLGGAFVVANGQAQTAYSAPALASLKAWASAQIDQALEGAIASSVVAYGANQFQADRQSAANLTAAVAAAQAGIALPAGFAWRSAANTNVPFSQADLVALGGLMLANTTALYQRCWTAKAAIATASSDGQVLAVAF